MLNIHPILNYFHRHQMNCEHYPLIAMSNIERYKIDSYFRFKKECEDNGEVDGDFELCGFSFEGIKCNRECDKI